MPAADRLLGQLVTLPPEAGDVDAPRFHPDEDWLRRASPEEQKAAMWRWFATRYDDPANPETPGPRDERGRLVFDDDAPCRANVVLHGFFDALVPPDTVEALVVRVQQEIGNDWARRNVDEFGG
ncbi:MAG TPA: hypothetical protein VGP22_02730 [Albitalea sp.]|jgi:hypothetical protein|nr:hypothetical protein [Albitalea sp.]